MIKIKMIFLNDLQSYQVFDNLSLNIIDLKVLP